MGSADSNTGIGPGLCGHCRHGQEIPAARSRFWLCARSRWDRRFPRYPRLPVLACAGYEAGDESQRKNRDQPPGAG